MHTPKCVWVCVSAGWRKRRDTRESCPVCWSLVTSVSVGRLFWVTFVKCNTVAATHCTRQQNASPALFFDDIFPVEGPPSIRPPCWIFVASIPPPPPRADVWWFLCLWLSIGFLVQLSLCVCDPKWANRRPAPTDHLVCNLGKSARFFHSKIFMQILGPFHSLVIRLLFASIPVLRRIIASSRKVNCVRCECVDVRRLIYSFEMVESRSSWIVHHAVCSSAETSLDRQHSPDIPEPVHQRPLLVRWDKNKRQPQELTQRNVFATKKK